MTPVTIPTATRPITLPDLDGLPAHLAAKLRNMPAEQLAVIFNLKDEQ
jgi:hypothetical protein